MSINFEIILNVWIGMMIYNLILASIGKVVLKYFLDHNKEVQQAKQKFQENLKEKFKEDGR